MKMAEGEKGVKTRARRIIKTLQEARPDAVVELDHSNPFQLVVATILSAQCTDERVNKVTPGVFARYSTPEALAQAQPRELETLIQSTGFFRNKAQSLIRCSQRLVEEYRGQVPQTMEELTTLPGIGRKTANVLLGACFSQPAVVVDTHVKRVANRLHLTESSDPTQIEFDLQALWPKADWTKGAQQLLLHGRYVCLARKPKCDQCVIFQDCLWEGKPVVVH